MGAGVLGGDGIRNSGPFRLKCRLDTRSRWGVVGVGEWEGRGTGR
jgi:hypothetical protein